MPTVPVFYLVRLMIKNIHPPQQQSREVELCLLNKDKAIPGSCGSAAEPCLT